MAATDYDVYNLSALLMSLTAAIFPSASLSSIILIAYYFQRRPDMELYLISERTGSFLIKKKKKKKTRVENWIFRRCDSVF